MKARCSGWRFCGVPKPSSVTTFCTAFSEDSGVTQLRTALPSTCTVQAPHCARPQPNRGPLRARLSRNTLSALVGIGPSHRTTLLGVVLEGFSLRQAGQLGEGRYG